MPSASPPFAPPNSRAAAPTFRNKDIFAWKVRRSGIAYSAMLEWYLAAHWWGYTAGEWDSLPQEEQETCIAVYRCEMQMQAILSEPKYADKPGRK